MKKFLERSFQRQPIVTTSEFVEPVPVVTPQIHIEVSKDEEDTISTESGPVIATISYFPQAMNSVTKIVVPEPCNHHAPKKTRKISTCSIKSTCSTKSTSSDHPHSSLSSRINKKFRSRRKSSAKNTTLEFGEQDEHMGKLLSKSLKAQENLKAIRDTLSAVASNQSYVSNKVNELRGRIDSLCELTHRIGKSMRHVERETKEIKKRQKTSSQSEYQRLLHQLEMSWSLDTVDALGRDESK